MGIVRNYFVSEKPLTENKNYSLQIGRYTPSFLYNIADLRICFFDDTQYFMIALQLFGDLFLFDLSWNKKRDHAGLTFNITLIGQFFEFMIYDCRHWDDENDKWETHTN